MSFADSLEKLKEFDVNDLDFNNAGEWPVAAKVVSGLVLLAAVLGGVYYFLIQDMEATYAASQQKEVELRQEYAMKAAQVANLEEYKAQMVEMQQTFGALLKQLPSETEVPGLLEDISGVGSSAGLQLDSIQLNPEISREFYVELPITIDLTGEYHDIAAFVSGVAGLPRIVTLHDFTITRNAGQDAADADRLSMKILAKTYRYSGGDQ
ncbi:type 4a pilus biogenesis protein PilO [Allohahella sp. A8]|uniref:type 4a pilus biogenesis protein PilO n=1 Tax=Allohahella sp. A8 TaxID=3141461 RepID=UPI000C095841|nr:pilus assembly protein PilP [Hahellaceae bacterium]|tara:strand:- start:31360 stop:31986 length:627 start_codon:yes stop_codon:yes gene_type:complete